MEMFEGEVSRSQLQDHIHAPLDLVRPEFRLVKILPRGEFGHIRCEVQRVNLALKPEFQALSYVWGPPSPIQVVEINGCQLEIRQNLWDFLNMFADSCSGNNSEAGWFFIDQLCIDQRNTKERNHQVLRMADIFSAAERTIVWLGKETALSRQCFDFINFWQAKAIYTPDKALQSEAQPLFNHLDSQQYWRRVWTIQELVLARSAMVYWGNDWIDFDALWRLQSHLGEEEFAMAYPFISGMIDARFCRVHECQLSWDDIANMVQGRNCENPCDRVYGMLGLIQRDQMWPRPDYSKPVSEVFKDLMTFGLAKEPWTEEEYYRCVEKWQRELGLSRYMLTPVQSREGQ